MASLDDLGKWMKELLDIRRKILSASLSLVRQMQQNAMK